MFRDGVPTHTTSSFERLSDEELEAHLGVARYGDFVLTDAMRPSYDLQVIPCQGYRHDVYRDEESKSNVPVLMGAASQGALVRDLHGHARSAWARKSTWCWKRATTARTSGHVDLYREHIDLPVLEEHPLRLRGPAGQRRLHGHRGAESGDPAGSAVRRAQAADRLRQGAARVRDRSSRTATCAATTR